METPPPTGFRCPHCDALIVNRALRYCADCQQTLPPSLALSSEQRQKLKAQREEEAKRHKHWSEEYDRLKFSDD